MRFRIRVEYVSPTYLGLGVRKIIILLCIHVEALPYTGGTRTPRLLGVRNYLNNFFTMHKGLTRTCIHVEVASPAYLELDIIYIIILSCINVWHAPVYAWNSHLPPTWS